MVGGGELAQGVEIGIGNVEQVGPGAEELVPGCCPLEQLDRGSVVAGAERGGAEGVDRGSRANGVARFGQEADDVAHREPGIAGDELIEQLRRCELTGERGVWASPEPWRVPDS